MGPVGSMWRTWLRRRWVGAALLVVLLGVGSSVGIAALAGARRTASAYDRVLDAAAAPDIISGHAVPPEAAIATIAGFDGVAASATDVGFTGFILGHDPALVPYYIGSYDNDIAQDRQLLTSGRYPSPDAPDEVLLTKNAADTARLVVGDQITINLFTPTFNIVPMHFTITGIGIERRDALGDASRSHRAVRLTPAFTRAHLDLMAWSRTSFFADDLDALVDDLLAAGYPIDETRAEEHERAQDSLRPLVLSLAVLGAIALVATALLVHQALAREVDSWADDRRSVRALGLGRGSVRSVDLLVLLTVVVPGLVVGAALAIGLSPLFPLGKVRALDPERGVAVDWTAMVLGLSLMAVVLTISYFVTTVRNEGRQPLGAVPSSKLYRTGTFVRATGLQFAMGNSREARRTFVSSVVLTTTAMVMVVGALTFVAGLDRLTGEPERYGFGADLVARAPYSDLGPESLVDQFGRDADITAMSGSQVGSLTIDGDVTVPTMGVLAISGEEIWPTIAQGRPPADDHELVLGRATMHALGVRIGDEVRLGADVDGSGGAGGGDDSGVTETATVVGQAVFAPVSIAGLDPPRLDEGAVLPWALFRRLNARALNAQADLSGPDVVYFDLAEDVDPSEIIRRYAGGIPNDRNVPTEWLTSLAPAEVIQGNDALPLLWAALIALTLAALGTVAHNQWSLVRARRSDYAILKTVGFTRRQVVATVAWQASSIMVLALVIGMPLGVAAGRLGWRSFAQVIGVIDTAVVPLTTITVAVVGALLLVNATSLAPAWLAAQTPPASALRED